MQLYEAKTEVLKTSFISVIGTYRLEKMFEQCLQISPGIYTKKSFILLATYIMFLFMKLYHD